MLTGSRRWLAAAAAAAAAGLSLLVPAVRHQLALSLIRQPARYTALSFTRPAGLPGQVRRGRPVTVGFEIANHEGRTARYRYLLTAAGAGRARRLGQAARTVPDGAAWRVSAQVRPACGAPRCQVTVALPGFGEHIDFGVSIRAGGRRAGGAGRG